MSRIHWAAKFGDPYMIRAEIESGVDVNSRSGPDGHTPLFPAVRAGHGVCVRVLIDHGADVNAASLRDLYPLNVASTIEMNRLLLVRGAKPDLPKFGGKTCAATFAQMGERGLAQLFLDFGADPLATGLDGFTVSEMMADSVRWPSSRARFQSERSEDKVISELMNLSDDLSLSPEEFVATDPGIMVWGCGFRDISDPALSVWAKRVWDILNSPEDLCASANTHLTSEVRAEALKRDERAGRCLAKQEELRQLQKSYEQQYYAEDPSM